MVETRNQIAGAVSNKGEEFHRGRNRFRAEITVLAREEVVLRRRLAHANDPVNIVWVPLLSSGAGFLKDCHRGGTKMLGTPLPRGGLEGNVNTPSWAGVVAIISVLIWIIPWATFSANAGGHSDGGKHHRHQGKSGIGIGIEIVPGTVSGHKKSDVKRRRIGVPIVE
jgi:hypothetical protein